MVEICFVLITLLWIPPCSRNVSTPPVPASASLSKLVTLSVRTKKKVLWTLFLKPADLRLLAEKQESRVNYCCAAAATVAVVPLLLPLLLNPAVLSPASQQVLRLLDRWGPWPTSLTRAPGPATSLLLSSLCRGYSEIEARSTTKKEMTENI